MSERGESWPAESYSDDSLSPYTTLSARAALSHARSPIDKDDKRKGSAREDFVNDSFV